MTHLDDKAKRRYQGRQGQLYHQAKRVIPESTFPWIARLRATKMAPHIRPTDTVLEYGVGLGWNLSALNCARKLGHDVGEFLESAVRQRGIEFVADAEKVADASIDVVICHHTLEHAWHPADLLDSIHRLLRSQGKLLLFVPYEKERRFQVFNPAEPNHHLYSWNVQTLGNLVQDAGFQIESVGLGRFGQERFAAIVAARLGLGETAFRMIHWLANRLKGECEVRLVAIKPQSTRS